MKKHVRITEVGRYYHEGNPYVVVIATVTHNGFVTKEEHWRIPWTMNTAIAGRTIASEYDAETWSYQTAWTLSNMETRPRPLRYLPDLLDTSEEL